jgi:hypothetical protein
MNTNSAKKVIVTVGAAAICISGSWVAAPAQATTDVGGGGRAAFSVVGIDEVVAMRKMEMAHDSVAYAAARAAYAILTADRYSR